MPVVLVTDALFWLLIAVSCTYAFYARRRESMLRPWRRLAHSRAAIASAIVILFYVTIALLDSIHFKPRLGDADNGQAVYSNELLSVFDLIVLPLRDRQEKTYSEPFALYAYVKETVNADGGQTRVYPRLQYGGSHLSDESEKAADILRLSVRGILEAIGIAVLLALLVVWRRAYRRRLSLMDAWREFLYERDALAWRVTIVTVAGLLILSFVSFRLGMQYHVFGTDKVGEDVFYQALKSIRTGVLIGTLTTLIMLPFALLLGIIAGYFLGWVDDFIQYVYMTLNSIPSVLLIAAAVLMLYLYMNQHQDEFNNLAVRADMRLLFLCAILGITSWTGLCRLLRAETLKLKSMDYITAANVLGVSRAGIILRHILPNVMHIVFITVALDFSGLVLAEAVLSYVSIGVDPTTHSWGNMINSARLEMARDPIVWWPLIASFVFMFGLVLCANLLADAVRDAFDPRSGVAK